MEYEEDVYVDILDEGPVDKGKGNVDSGEFDRWDGGSVSGADDSDHFYSRYRHEGGDYGGSRSYKQVRSVVESRHEAEDKGGSLSSRHRREVESDEEEGEERFSGRHRKRESGDKERKRSYRRRNVGDGDSSDEEDAGQYTRKLDTHVSENKEHERNYRCRRVVDDDYSDEEEEEEGLFMGKVIVHECGDTEHSRNYRHRRVVDDDYSDDKPKEEQFTRKLIVRGSGDKEHKRIYRRRRVVDDDYSDDEVEERHITSKLIIRGSGDEQHCRNSKRRRVADDDYSDDNFEFAAKCSKERDDSGSQDWHGGKILSRRHSRSRDEKMSEDHLEKDRDRSKRRDNSHEKKRGLQQDKHLKHDRYDKEDKYKRRSKDMHKSTRYISENDDEVDDWDRERLGKERHYDYKKERGRSANEEKYDGRRDMHRSARYQSENHDDYDLELAVMERKRNYVCIKGREIDAEEDKYNSRQTGMHHSTRYQIEHDDDDWERERCSWEGGREMIDNSYEIKHMKREKDRDFRGRDKESLRRTLLIERGKEGDVREPVEDPWEESQKINWHVKGRIGRRETDYVRRDLRIQITEAKEKSHRRELADVEKERDSTEQQSQSLDMSLQRELEERQKERDFRGRDTECMGKGKEIQWNKKNKGGSWKLNISETTINQWEREPRGKICEKEKIHKVIRKKDLIERDITSMVDSHRRKWDREMGEVVSKRDFCEKDSRKQDMEDLMHVAKETDSEDYNTRSREMSQEIEWERKTRQRYQKREFMSRDKRGREGLERDGVFRLSEKFLNKQDKEQKEERQERGFNRGRETTRSDFVERDIWKPDIDIREKSLEMEVMHKESERDFMSGVRQKELLSKADEKYLGESDRMSHKKTLENESEDNENRRELMTWGVDMEKSQQKELLNKEEDKSRREGVKRSRENTLENDRNSVVRDSVCRESCTKTIEGETVKELQEKEEKCRYKTLLLKL